MKDDLYHLVQYTGPFGYIKPWTAVRDSETFSQQFLTPSILSGMEQKLFPELLRRDNEPFKIHRIASHRLSYSGLSSQQEQTQPRGWNKRGNTLERSRAILVRGVMLSPVLTLAFWQREHAEEASRQHLCLCRNEDIILPDSVIQTISVAAFDEPPFNGFELVFADTDQSFTVGYNRFDSGSEMKGWLKIVGNPTQKPSF